MDYTKLAELLFPNVTDTPEALEERFPLRYTDHVTVHALITWLFMH